MKFSDLKIGDKFYWVSPKGVKYPETIYKKTKLTTDNPNCITIIDEGIKVNNNGLCSLNTTVVKIKPKPNKRKLSPQVKFQKDVEKRIRTIHKEQQKLLAKLLCNEECVWDDKGCYFNHDKIIDLLADMSDFHDSLMWYMYNTISK